MRAKIRNCAELSLQLKVLLLAGYEAVSSMFHSFTRTLLDALT